MAFSVQISAKAASDIDEAVGFIASDSRSRADKWLRELSSLVESLTTFPNRNALIPESQRLGRPLRSALHYSHRAIYEVDDEHELITIVRVYHGSRRALSRGSI